MTARELQPFDQRTLLALIALGAVAFLAMAYLMISGESGRSPRLASPTSTSRSAIGYRAFVELLRRFDLAPVAPTSPILARASLRIVLDPKDPQNVREALRTTSRPIMIVLPKWVAYAAPWSDRVSEAHLLAEPLVQSVAREISGDMEIVRPRTVTAWRNDGVQGEPTLQQPQLVRSASLCPLVSSDQGVLIGRLCRRPSVVVLADPDLLANNGLWRGDNAVLALSVVERLRAGNGPIVALEAVREVPPSRSIWQLALSPPFVMITFTAVIAIGVALWMAAMRFGPPADEEPERSPGVITLIDVAARLMSDKADGRRLLQRYADLLVLDLGRRLHAPQTLHGGTAVGSWIDSTRNARREGPTYGDLVRSVGAIAGGNRAAPAAAIAAARQLHRWREEVLNGR